MPSARVRRSVSALVLFALLPLSALHAAPSRDRAVARKPPTAMQRLERQLSSLWSGVVNAWEKMGPRIDDNGFLWKIENEIASREEGVQPKPLS